MATRISLAKANQTASAGAMGQGWTGRHPHGLATPRSRALNQFGVATENGVRGREVLDHPKSEALANPQNCIQNLSQSKKFLGLWQGLLLRMKEVSGARLHPKYGRSS